MPCCVCEQDHLTWKDSMMATAWFICDDCRQRRDISQYLPEDPPDPVDHEPASGPEADDFAVSPV